MNQFPPPPQHPGIPPPTEPTANASLILGMLFCLGPFSAIPAIICGHVARGRIARSGGALGGNGLAIAGMVLGYASNILFVAFFAIFVRYSSKVKSNLAKPSVTAQQLRLIAALTDYKADFGQFPAIFSLKGEQVDTKNLVQVLRGNNANGKQYYATGGQGFEFNGLPADPWLQTLNVAIDLDGNGTVKVGQNEVLGVCAVWSSGPNKKNEYGAGDDVVSW